MSLGESASQLNPDTSFNAPLTWVMRIPDTRERVRGPNIHHTNPPDQAKPAVAVQYQPSHRDESLGEYRPARQPNLFMINTDQKSFMLMEGLIGTVVLGAASIWFGVVDVVLEGS